MSLREWGIYLRPFFAAGTLALLGLAALSGTMMSLPEMPAVAAVQGQPVPAHGRLVFVITTGFEDLQKMKMSLAGSLAAKQSGALDDVVWLACGRGVEALANIGARPREISDLAHQAQAAGVHMLVCKGAIESLGLDNSRLDPAPDQSVVQGMVALSQLVAQGYQVVQP